VNEAKKQEIAERWAGRGRWRLALTFGVWLAMFAGMVVALALLSGHDEPTALDFFVLLVLAACSLIFCLHACYALTMRPILAGLAEAPETSFSKKERRDAIRKALGLHSWLLAGVIWSIVCITFLHSFFLKTHGGSDFSFDGPSVAPLVAAIIAGLAASSFVYREIARLRGGEIGSGQAQLTAEALAARLRILEDDNTSLRRSLAYIVAVCAAFAVGALVLSNFLGRVLSAESLVLRNAKGEAAVIVSGGKNGEPSLGLYGDGHKLRMVIALGRDGAPQVALYNSDEKLRAAFDLDTDGSPAIQLYRPDGTSSRVNFKIGPPQATTVPFSAGNNSRGLP
jgi:hypothetical protein